MSKSVLGGNLSVSVSVYIPSVLSFSRAGETLGLNERAWLWAQSGQSANTERLSDLGQVTRSLGALIFSFVKWEKGHLAHRIIMRIQDLEITI